MTTTAKKPSLLTKIAYTAFKAVVILLGAAYISGIIMVFYWKQSKQEIKDTAKYFHIEGYENMQKHIMLALSTIFCITINTVMWIFTINTILQ